MTMRRFSQLDVFASGPFSGNPLACVIDADGLSTEQMQEFTKWANLSESSFLLEPTAPEADYRVRIFTPDQELPFAGHPIIGSCQAWLNAGGQPKTRGRVVQECGVGLVQLRLGGDHVAFAAPPLIRSGEVEESLVAEMAEVLGIDRSDVVGAQWGDNGPGSVIPEAIDVWISHWNDDPKPFVWTKTANDIITKVQRGRAINHLTKSATHH